VAAVTGRVTDEHAADIVDLSFGCTVTGADVCLLVRFPDGREVHMPGSVEKCPVCTDQPMTWVRTCWVCESCGSTVGPRLPRPFTIYVGGRRDEFEAYCRETGLDHHEVLWMHEQHATAGVHHPHVRVVYGSREHYSDERWAVLVAEINYLRTGTGVVEEVHLDR
jgi:hypothetical protein